MWMSPGQQMGGYGLLLPPGAPPQPPHFNCYVVPQPPPGGFAPSQGFGAPPQYGMGNYPQDPSGCGPTGPSQTYGQAEQGYSAAGYGQDMSGFGQAPDFSDPNQPAPSWRTLSTSASRGSTICTGWICPRSEPQCSGVPSLQALKPWQGKT